ncbi:MAG: tRNA epoxyqueuosine(34) reductase QueG [Candidatus Marinimicrobia bacterium]|jgi:epoxyqueuosine reductase|nr:tRNA epoxyqueuosine(34) reductase QueG [Candidatus Neomarinimicrobiota bacterium]
MESDLSVQIKEHAKSLGFQKTGIAPAEPIPKQADDLNNWLSLGRHATMQWMENRKEERADIHSYFPEAKSVVSVAMVYHSGHEQSDSSSNFKLSNYAWGDDYHDVLKSKLFQLLKWLKRKQPDMKGIVCVDTSPVMEKVWAQKAGLGWQGKHTNLISRDYGSWFFLGELIVDITLDYDEPFSEDLCGTCTACIDTCPTQALEEYKIDSGKCISYLTIEHKGDFPEGRDDLHGWIYGCDICQEVCPWNEKFGKSTTDPAFQPRPEIIDFSDKDWNAMDEDSFRKLFKGSAVKRTKYSGLKRNIVNNQH